MTERPILFSADMVRAILDGNKTQTRRIAKARQAGEHVRHTLIDCRCQYGVVGDRLWVREAFSYAHGQGLDDHGPIWYWADGNPEDGDWTKPKPSIHMPRWASRITLEITEVRLEQLQAISEEDALAEGVGPGPRHRDPFGLLWEHIHGPGSWYANPFVWVVSFQRITP